MWSLSESLFADNRRNVETEHLGEVDLYNSEIVVITPLLGSSKIQPFIYPSLVRSFFSYEQDSPSSQTNQEKYDQGNLDSTFGLIFGGNLIADRLVQSTSSRLKM